MMKMWSALVVNAGRERIGLFMNPQRVITVAKTRRGAISRIRARLEHGEEIIEIEARKSLVYRV